MDTTPTTSYFPYSNTSYTYTNYAYQPPKINLQKVKEIRKKQKIKEMKDKWTEFRDEIKPLIMRPSIQLRGVCLNGRGWL